MCQTTRSVADFRLVSSSKRIPKLYRGSLCSNWRTSYVREAGAVIIYDRIFITIIKALVNEELRSVFIGVFTTFLVEWKFITLFYLYKNHITKLVLFSLHNRQQTTKLVVFNSFNLSLHSQWKLHINRNVLRCISNQILFPGTIKISSHWSFTFHVFQ